MAQLVVFRPLDALMNKTAIVLIVAWCLWLIARLSRVIFFDEFVAIDYGGGIIIPLICFGVGHQLYKKPSRSLSRWFYFTCFLVLGKFCLGTVIYYYGSTYSIFGALVKWWTLGMKGVFPFTDTIGATVLVLATIYYWPSYCLKRSTVQNVKPAAKHNT